MGRTTTVPPITLTMAELRWLHSHLCSALGPTGYYHRGETFRRCAASVRDKVQAHILETGIGFASSAVAARASTPSGAAE